MHLQGLVGIAPVSRSLQLFGQITPAELQSILLPQVRLVVKLVEFLPTGIDFPPAVLWIHLAVAESSPAVPGIPLVVLEFPPAVFEILPENAG